MKELRSESLAAREARRDRQWKRTIPDLIERLELLAIELERKQTNTDAEDAEAIRALIAENRRLENYHRSITQAVIEVSQDRARRWLEAERDSRPA